MRIRAASAAAALSLAIIGVCFAQQAHDDATPSTPKSPAQAKLGEPSKLARLRAEVELMEIEHAVDVELLKAFMLKTRTQPQFYTTVTQATETVNTGAALGAGTVTTTVNLAVQLDAQKQQFLDSTTALNEKKLALMELEQRFQDALGK